MMAARLGKARDDGTPGGYCRSYDRVLGGTTAIDRDIVAAVCMQLTAGCDYAQSVFERYDQYAVYKNQWKLARQMGDAFKLKIVADIEEYRAIDWDPELLDKKTPPLQLHVCSKLNLLELQIWDLSCTN